MVEPQEFCAPDPASCRPVGSPVAAVSLTAQRLSELDSVTQHVNHGVKETPDYQQFGREDVWSYPTNGKTRVGRATRF